MDLSLSDEERQLVEAMAGFFERESSAERIRAVEELGFDARLWENLQGLGIPSLAAAADGAERATLFQLALIAEQAGRALASAPVLESLTALRLLDRCGEVATDLLETVQSGGLVATVSLRRLPADRGRVVPAGAVAEVVIGLDGEELVAVRRPPPGISVANLGNLAAARRDLVTGERTILARGDEATAAFDWACRDWKTLGAAQLTGVAAAALDLGVDYVKSREVFGAAIATFQTIAHKLADDATAVDGARLLTYEAAWAADEKQPRAAALASMAWCFAAETALAVSRDALHYHGGYGFTTEYDIQLYFRKAKAYALLWGDPKVEYQRLGELLLNEGSASEL